MSNQSFRNRLFTLIALTHVALSPALVAQTGVRGANASDRIARLLFAPELVMSHQAELGLTREQKNILVAEMQQTQSDLVPLQLEMAEIGGELGRLLAQARIDEEAAVAAAGRVMDLEARIKTRHLILVVRIKNMLSAEQQTTLRRIRQRQWEQRRNGGGR